MARNDKGYRNILALSGGKDSAALAVYLKDRIPDMEYVFLDTGHELPETHEYLDRMRAILGININTIQPKRSFEDWLKIKGFYLPSKQKRWCTELLKIKPYEEYIGNSLVNSYIGIRADENRDGYISNINNIIPKYPFIKDNLVLSDIENILDDSGLGFPSYHEWRSRSGCYFCFFQQTIEWINLYERHEDLFIKAMNFEKVDAKTGKMFTWREKEPLSELIQRKDQIKEEYESRKSAIPQKRNGKLIQSLSGLTTSLKPLDF